MRYHDITKDDMKNGDGLRCVLWLSGCDHGCPGCQNPITWDPRDGLLFDKRARDEIFEQLAKSYISGITFSGGDPMHGANRKGVLELAQEIKKTWPEKTIWLYTGYHYDEVASDPLMEYLDVLVDGPFIQEEYDGNLLWKGSKNQRVIDVPASREMGEIVLHCGDYKSVFKGGASI